MTKSSYFSVCFFVCLSGLVGSVWRFFFLVSKYQSSHYQIEYIRRITEFRLMLKRQLTLYRAYKSAMCLCESAGVCEFECEDACIVTTKFISIKMLSQADIWRCFRVRRVDFKAWPSHVFLHTHTQSKNGSKCIYRRLSSRRAVLETYVF